MKTLLLLLLLAACAPVFAQGTSQDEHVPPDPPQTHMHDMSYREMVEMMGMNDRKPFGKLTMDRLEWQDTDDGSRFGWEADAWYGGDYHKAWLQAEGERASGETHESRIEAGWDRIVSAWWSVRVGLRHDGGEGPAREWLGAGFAGLAPGFIETEATLYVGEDSRTAARFNFERDFLFTQRLVLQPKLEMSLYGRDDPEKLIGSGLSDLKIGLRLRYEVWREFAPYLGLQWEGHFGESADLRRAAGEDADELLWVAGVRAWF